MVSFLPDAHGGILPYYLLYTSIAAILHAVACYRLPYSASMKMFSATPASQLTGPLAHSYAVKNMYTGLIRGLAAYYITNPQLYYLAIASYAGVAWLFSTETFVFKSVKFRLDGSVIPLLQGPLGVAWMWFQRGWYLG